MHVYARALTHRPFCRVVERPEGVERVRGSVRVGGEGRIDGGVAPGARGETVPNAKPRRKRIARRASRADAPTRRRTVTSRTRTDARDVPAFGRYPGVRRIARRRARTPPVAPSAERPNLVSSPRQSPPAPPPRDASPSPSPRQRSHVTRSLLPASACARDMSRIADAPAPPSSPTPSPPPRSVSNNSSVAVAAAAASTTPSRTTYPRVSSERSASSSIGAASGG